MSVFLLDAAYVEKYTLEMLGFVELQYMYNLCFFFDFEVVSVDAATHNQRSTWWTLESR